MLTTNVVEITSTEPMITGKSRLFNASTISFPNPFQPKYIQQNSTCMEANHPEIAVTTGFKEFLKHAFE
jgi:hypothetical protein